MHENLKLVYLAVETSNGLYRCDPEEFATVKDAINTGRRIVTIEHVYGGSFDVVVDKIESYYISSPEVRAKIRELNKAVEEEGENEEPSWK